MTASAGDIIRALGLAPHPEGGHYRETFRHVPAAGGRGAMTAIYYLLRADEVSAWHRIDAAEIWHFYAGAPLALTLSPDGRDAEAVQIGPDLAAGQRPQAIVPPGCWQTAQSLGAWTLVGCTVGPAFTFAGFELAPPGWRPLGLMEGRVSDPPDNCAGQVRTGQLRNKRARSGQNLGLKRSSTSTR